MTSLTYPRLYLTFWNSIAEFLQICLLKYNKIHKTSIKMALNKLSIDALNLAGKRVLMRLVIVT